MRGDHLFISTQFIEILGGYKCKSPHPERGAQKGGKSQSSNRSRSHRSFHTSPPELGRWRQPAASFRLPLCLLQPHRTHLASPPSRQRPGSTDPVASPRAPPRLPRACGSWWRGCAWRRPRVDCSRCELRHLLRRARFFAACAAAVLAAGFRPVQEWVSWWAGFDLNKAWGSC